MDPDFWHQRWRTGQIGFHQSSPHPFLERWWPSLRLPPGSRIYVPLCGKSLDMVWLAVRGYRVVGSELSAIAVQEFFGERDDVVERAVRGPFTLHRSRSFEIFEGDALQLTTELLGPVQGGYDRGALVALPPAMRNAYVANFAALVPPQSPTLLVGLEYDEAVRDGPPFSVRGQEVRALYDESFAVRELERVDIIEDSPRFAAQGLRSLHEVAYELVRR
jgi:thiopurine S-methyltransferase